MTEFEFLMTLMSVLLAIGLAEILSGWGKVARSEERVRIYPLSLFWSVYLVVFAIAMWSRYWGFQVAEFSGMKILFLMMQTLIFVLVAYMLAPDPVPGRHYDMEAVYWRMARPVSESHLDGFVTSGPLRRSPHTRRTGTPHHRRRRLAPIRRSRGRARA